MTWNEIRVLWFLGFLCTVSFTDARIRACELPANAMKTIVFSAAWPVLVPLFAASLPFTDAKELGCHKDK